MGFFDFLPCCGRRDKDGPSDTDPLLPPREGSIASQDAYGAVSMSATTTLDGAQTQQERLSTSARARIDRIGREVGNHMLPINQASRSARHPSAQRPASPGGESSEPSRPPTPSPRRPAPSNGVMSPSAEGEDRDDSKDAASTTASANTDDAEEVVKKQLFHNAPGGARGGGRGRAKNARGRGRGRSKKAK